MNNDNNNNDFRKAAEERLKRLGVDDLSEHYNSINNPWTPEEWYQQLKRRWFLHRTSWYLYEEVELYTKKCDHPLANISYVDDRRFCTPVHGCIKECSFYPDKGRLEPSTIQEAIEGLNKFPHLAEARKELEQEKKELQDSIIKKRKSLSYKQRQELDNNKPPFFKLLEGKVFWIWGNRHLHLQEFLMTQSKCCWNHCIGEMEKWGAPMPLW